MVFFRLIRTLLGIWVVLVVGSLSFLPRLQVLPGKAYAETSSQSTKVARSNKSVGRMGRGWVSAVRYSSDGKYVAVATSIGVELRDAATLAEIRFLQGHSGPVGSIAFSPDGATLASGSYDKTVILWKTETGKKLTTLQGHQNWVTALAFSKDGTLLASGSYDEKIILWDLKEGKELKTLHGHKDRVLSVAFSPDGALLASGGSDDQIVLWDIQKGTQLKTLSGYRGAVQSLAFNPDGSLLASGSDDSSVILWDVKKGEKVHTIWDHQDAVKSVTFNSDGTLLASGGFDGTIRLWDISPLERGDSTRHEGTEVRGRGDAGRVPPSPRPHLSASKIFRNPAHHVWSIAFSPKGRFLISASENLLAQWDLQNRPETDFTPSQVVKDFTSPLWSSALSPDRTLLALAGDNGALDLWNLTSTKNSIKAQRIRSLRGHLGAVRTVAFNQDGTLLASGGEDKQIILWDAKSGVRKRILEGHSGSVLKVAFSPDGHFLVSGGDDQKILIWDLQTGENVRTLLGHNRDVLALTFKPDGKVLVSASSDGTIILWDIGRGESISTLTRPSNWMSSFAISPDGVLLALGNLDNSVTLLGQAQDTVWSVLHNTEVGTLQGHTEPVWSLAFSPDGSLLATAGSDSRIFLWTVGEGRLVKILESHTSWINCLSFSSDGTFLISGGFDGTAHIWKVEKPEVVAKNAILSPSEESEKQGSMANEKEKPKSPKVEAQASMPLPQETKGKEKSPTKEKSKANSQRTYQKWYELGLQRMAEKKWESAIENLKLALEEKQTPEAEEKLKEAMYHRWYDLGTERMKETRWEDAIESFTFALSLLDTRESRQGLREATYHKWYETGIQQAEQKLWAQAAESFTLALGFWDTEEAHVRLKEARYAKWYQMGIEQFDRGRWTQARESFTLALQEKDTDEAWFKLKEATINQYYQNGQMRAQQQNWNQAIVYFTQALEEAESLRSEDLHLDMFLGEEMQKKLDMIQSSIYYAQGSLTTERQDWVEAGKLFKKALEANPDHEDARRKLEQNESVILQQVKTLLSLGEEKLKEWDWDAAKAFFLRAQDIRPSHPEVSDKLKEVEAGLRYLAEDQQRERQLLRAQQEHQVRSTLEKQARQKTRARYQFVSIGILGSLTVVLLLLRIKPLHRLTAGSFMGLRIGFLGSPALRAAFYKTLGQYPKAAEIYEKMLEENSEKFWIYLLLADLYLRMGRQDEKAVEIYDRALSLGFIHPEAIIPVSRYYLRDLRISERALWIFDNALKLHPDNLALLRAILLKARMLLPENPSHLRLLSLFLKACQNTNTLDEGIAFLQEIVPIDPSLIDLYLDLANLFLDKGKHHPARDYLVLAYKFILQSKGDPSGRLHIARLEAIYERIVLELGQDPTIHYNLGLLYQRQGRIRKAIREFRKIDKIPGWQRLSQNKLMECREAMITTRLLLCLRPSALKIHFYSFIGAWDQAIQVYEDLLRKNPRKVWIYPRLSTLYLKIGRLDTRAFWVHHRTLFLDPEQPDVALCLAYCYLRRRTMTPRAIWVYERALEFQPNNIEFLNVLLEAGLKTHREDLLNKVCKRLYHLGYRNRIVYQVLSRSCLEHRRIDREAMLIYRNVLQWEPNNRALQEIVEKFGS